MNDVIIVGGGVAAYSAALFAARRGLKVLILAKDIGGQANFTDLIENYPGVVATGGYDLVQSIKTQAENFGVETVLAEVSKVKKVESGFVVTAYGHQYKSKSIILAFGKTPRDLNVPGEEDFKGRGVTYCANCDAPLYKGKDVVVAGIGDTNLDAILLLSKFAHKVYALSKTDKLAGHPGLVKAVGKKKNVELMPFVQILEVVGKEHIESLNLLNLQTNQKSILKIDGLFVELGYVVSSGFLLGVVELDSDGQIIIGLDQSTSVPGIFAAGDATNRPYKQAVISAGEGATAALGVFDWLAKQEGNEGLTSDWTQIKKIK